jgi:hypothetical protein
MRSQRLPTWAKALLPVLLLLGSISGGYGAERFHTDDPLRAFVRGDYPWGDDYFIHGADDTTLLRCVLTKTRDGLDGLALSEASIWGNHGGPWEIFRRTRRGFVYVGPGTVRTLSCLESCQSKDYLASGRCRWQPGWPTSPAPTPTAPSASSSVVTLEPAELDAEPFECDCEFYRGRVDGRSVVFATRQHRTHGLVKVDGTVLQLRPVTTVDETVCRKGHRHTGRWTEGSTSIDLDTVVTKAGDEACWYRGALTLTRGSTRVRIAVTGSCGC